MPATGHAAGGADTEPAAAASAAGLFAGPTPSSAAMSAEEVSATGAQRRSRTVVDPMPGSLPPRVDGPSHGRTHAARPPAPLSAAGAAQRTRAPTPDRASGCLAAADAALGRVDLPAGRGSVRRVVAPSAHELAARLRAAGCVYAEDEAALLLEAADGDPAALEALLARRGGGEARE